MAQGFAKNPIIVETDPIFLAWEAAPVLGSLTLTGTTASLPVFTDAGKVLVTKTIADARTALGLGTGDSPTLTGLLLSGLTVSRLVVTDGSKNLASNAAITTNYLTKSTSSGAGLAASLIYDNGTTVCIGTTSPYAGSLLHLNSNSTTQLVLDAHASGDGAYLRVRHARGTIGAETATQMDDPILTLVGAGHTGAAYTGSKGVFRFFAAENWTPTANGTYFTISTTAIGTTGLTERLRVDGSGNVGIGLASFGANAVTVLGIKNGTVPAASVADAIQIFSVDSSDAAATLGLFLEATVAVVGATAATHKVKIKINGTEYYLLISTV